LWVPALAGWLVTRRDLALHVMRDSATFTVDDPRFSTGQVVGPSMLTLDGAEHAATANRLRRPPASTRREHAIKAARRAHRFRTGQCPPRGRSVDVATVDRRFLRKRKRPLSRDKSKARRLNASVARRARSTFSSDTSSHSI
jgi:hypothetical protein